MESRCFTPQGSSCGVFFNLSEFVYAFLWIILLVVSKMTRYTVEKPETIDKALELSKKVKFLWKFCKICVIVPVVCLYPVNIRSQYRIDFSVMEEK